ncbi:temptin-like [Argopecten irradians]|uniref:temptin-like n=1 Tax=Argopecten irradians TaxID=31199 RepID=UPI00371AE21F
MALKHVLLAITCYIFVGLCLGYPPFMNYIPNSRRVPDPCFTRTRTGQTRYVQALGHYGDFSRRNPFGQDFWRTRGNWTILCRLDSDKDGLYNGYELGDRYCVWKPRDPRTWRYLRVPYGHPGVAETFNNRTKRYEVEPQLLMDVCSRNFPFIS